MEGKYSGKENRKRPGYIKEKDKQTLRKKENPVSRILDNYYWPKLHNRAWWPNGLYTITKRYYYADSGLGYHYEKNNVEQLREINRDDIINKKPLPKDYVENSFLSDNQFTVTIEYCANCEEHKTHTRHDPYLYKNFALQVQRCIVLRFPFIKVILKPIDTDILNEDAFKLPKLSKNGQAFNGMPNVNVKFKEVRIGAMEIQINGKKEGNKEIEKAILHSKLKTGTWPKINDILKKIVSFLPMFSGKVQLYEKQEMGIEPISLSTNQTGNNDEDNIEVDSILKGLKVNVYLLNNENIQDIIEEINEEVENEVNPHKRKEKLKQEKRFLKENGFIQRAASAKSIRGVSRITTTTTQSKGVRPTSSKMKQHNVSTTTCNNMNSFNGGNTYLYNDNPRDKQCINDKAKADKIKGKLIVSKYTDYNGVITFGPIPYDSYLIEVEESNNFKFTSMPLTFNTINPKNSLITKYIGLYTQERTFLQLHIYETITQGDKEDKVHINDANVTLKTCIASGIDAKSQIEDKEEKIKLDEIRPGIFEHVVNTGRYLLEVQKEGYDLVRKFCDLDKGLNNVNIELTKARNCLLKVVVYNFGPYYENKTYEPIRNAEITIYLKRNEPLYEGITNKKGEMEFMITDNSDFLCVVVNKIGYKTLQRTFIRNKNESNDNKNTEHDEETLYFLMIHDQYFEGMGVNVVMTFGYGVQNGIEPIIKMDEAKIGNDLKVETLENKDNTDILVTLIQYVQPDQVQESMTNQDDDDGNPNDFSKILSLSYRINDDNLKINNYQDKGWSMNGLDRYGYETIIITPINSFHLVAPKLPDNDYFVWELGWLDVENFTFFETNYLSNDIEVDRLQYFEGFLDFLQYVIDNKLLSKLFTFFGFDKGFLINNDRYIYDTNLRKILEQIGLNNNNNNNNEADLISMIMGMMYDYNKMTSFTILKKKIFSNMRNFKDNLPLTQQIALMDMNNNYDDNNNNSNNNSNIGAFDQQVNQMSDNNNNISNQSGSRPRSAYSQSNNSMNNNNNNFN